MPNDTNGPQEWQTPELESLTDPAATSDRMNAGMRNALISEQATT